MRTSPWWPVVACILITGCDIDFVAVAEPRAGLIQLRSEHRTAFETSIDLVLPDESGPPRVRVGGVELQWEREAELWRSQTSLSADTLQPEIEVVIQGRGDPVLVLPLVARNGAGVWRPEGDLELPVVRGGATTEVWQETWWIALVDANGRQLVGIHSSASPMPRPLVLSREQVPPQAVAAELSVNLYGEAAGGAYPLNVGISSRIHIPIPSNPSHPP